MVSVAIGAVVPARHSMLFILAAGWELAGEWSPSNAARSRSSWMTPRRSCWRPSALTPAAAAALLNHSVDLIRRRNLKPELQAEVEAEAVAL
jgi:hypothetical protein